MPRRRLIDKIFPKLRAEERHLRAKIGVMNATIETQRSKIEQIQKERQDAEARADELRDDKAKLNDKIRELKQELEEAHRTHEVLAQRVTTLQTANQELRENAKSPD